MRHNEPIIVRCPCCRAELTAPHLIPREEAGAAYAMGVRNGWEQALTWALDGGAFNPDVTDDMIAMIEAYERG